MPQSRCRGPFQTHVPRHSSASTEEEKSPQAQACCSSLCFIQHLLSCPQINPPRNAWEVLL